MREFIYFNYYSRIDDCVNRHLSLGDNGIGIG